MEKIIDRYIEENRWYITASKLKCFIKSPEDFFLKYIKEIEPLNKKEKKHFKLWQALDDYISYWEKVFNEKYFIDEWLNKWEIEKRLLEQWVDTKWLLVIELKELLYWDITNKIKLTKLDFETVNWCLNELTRQPLFNKDDKYIYQKTFIWQYKSLKLKCTLDRYKVWEIRDTKTTKSISSFIWDWKSKLLYDVSMSFYWVLINKATNEKSKLLLDVVQKTFPYPSRIFEIPQWDIIETVNQTIIPALDTLDTVMKAWEETKNEDVWKVRQLDFNKLSSCEMYPIMETAIQENIEILQ